MTTFGKTELVSLIHITKDARALFNLGGNPNENLTPEALFEAQKVATQVHRLAHIGNPDSTKKTHQNQDILDLVDTDLQQEIEREIHPDGVLIEEKKGIESSVKELGEKSSVFHSLFQREKKRYKKMRILLGIYTSRSYKEKSIDEETRNHVGRQLIIELKHFQKLLKNLIQSAHNSVAGDRREYTQSDSYVLNLYTKTLKEIERKMQELFGDNYEIAIQSRKDELKNLSSKLKGKKTTENELGSKFVTPPSRTKTIYGDNTAGNYILSALRNGNNVELLGPTGTGKTRLAMEVCEQFSGKKPYIISGGPGVSRRDFYGSPTGLNTRNPGAIETCIKEDKVFILDEDNRIDPRQIAEIKLLLGLKSGDSFTHPDTGEVFIVPPHFRIMTTRNEKGKHHTDRFDLPPDYRREFTHGSFEIGYYTPQEMYDYFLLPKLINDDGSISLSPEEVGGNEIENEYSPLLSLVQAAQVIQESYKKHELKNSVFESGYLIDFFDGWKEVRFKESDAGEKVTFIQYIETKFIEFLKRPIGNPDRQTIIGILMVHGFFQERTYEEFVTEGDGAMMSNDKFTELLSSMQSGSTPLFEVPRSQMISAYDVALLDPFNVRKIVIPEHPQEELIESINQLIIDICSRNFISPPLITGQNIDKKETRVLIVQKIIEVAKKTGASNLTLMESTLEKTIGKETKEFLNEIALFIARVIPKAAIDTTSSGTRTAVNKIIKDGGNKEPKKQAWGNLKSNAQNYEGTPSEETYRKLIELQEEGVDIDIEALIDNFSDINISGIISLYRKDPEWFKSNLIIRISDNSIGINGVSVNKRDERIVYTHEEVRRSSNNQWNKRVLSLGDLESFSPDKEKQKLICEYILGMSTTDDYIVYNKDKDSWKSFSIGKPRNSDYGDKVRLTVG